MVDIAKAAGISRTTLYKYYKSIHEIAFAVQSLLMLEIADYESTSEDEHSSVIDALIERIRASFRYTLLYKENRRFTIAFDGYYSASPIFNDISPEILENYRTLITGMCAPSINLLKSGVERQELRNDLPITVMTSIVFGLIIAHNQRLSTHGYDISLGDKDGIDALNEAFLEMVINYIKR